MVMAAVAVVAGCLEAGREVPARGRGGRFEEEKISLEAL